MVKSILVLLALVLVGAWMIGCGSDEPTSPGGGTANRAPGTPTIDTGAGAPADGSTDEAISSLLHWQCSDPDGDDLTFDVFFGTAADPPSVATGQTPESYNPGTLDYSTTYYWKVVAEDPDEETASSAVWGFTTMAPAAGTVSDPDTPTGLAAGDAGVSLSYTTGGSVSSQGHSVEYRFDWDDGTTSAWSASTTVSYSWAAAGTYNVKAQARCASHNGIESAWSAGLDVVITVTGETVSTPGAVSGPATGYTTQNPSYIVASSTSSMVHTVEYQYDWGDGSFSTWSTSNGASHNWPAAGSYDVKAQARCQDHTAIVSSWTAAYTVDITAPVESVSQPRVTHYPDFLELGVEGMFVGNYAQHNLYHPLEYQFDYGDGTIGPWLAATNGAQGPYTYAAVGTYEVKVRARCADHNAIVSDWSDNEATVTVYTGAEAVSTPYIVSPTPGEDRTTWVGRELRFNMAGRSSSHGHTLEYRYDLGDGTIIPWSSSPEYRYTYNAWGDYQVKGQARCRDHSAIESAWSAEITIHIVERITAPAKVTGPTNGVVEVPVTFNTTGSTSDEGHALEYQFYVCTSYLNLESGFGGQGWQSSMELEFTFPTGLAGRYYILVKARCATHTTVESYASTYFSIMVSN
jgi:hypothetical protein